MSQYEANGVGSRKMRAPRASKAKNVIRKNSRQEREDSRFVRREVEKYRTQQRRLARQMKYAPQNA